MDQKGLLFGGTSGLTLPVKNKSLFPPEYQDKSRLTFYGSLFNSLEINSSFYKLPMASTVRRWTTEVPAGFRFTYKLWRNITHNKGLVYDPADITRFMEVINHAGGHKGCLLVQFPASITIAYRSQMEKLLHDLNEANTDVWPIAIEFRSKTWYRDDIYQLLDGYRMSIVLHDMPASATPMLDQDTDFIYLRFHGPNGGYRGSYTDDFLYEYASYIRDWQADGKNVYVYFNNTMGDAIQNLVTLNNIIAAEQED